MTGKYIHIETDRFKRYPDSTIYQQGNILFLSFQIRHYHDYVSNFTSVIR